MPISRREYLLLVGQTAFISVVMPRQTSAAPQEPEQPEMQRRIRDVIRGYETQGFHRTGTDVDRVSGEWLMDQVRDAGVEPIRETFSLDRVDPITASLSVNGRQISGLPFFDGGFTSPNGIGGRLGDLNSGAPIGLTEIAPNTEEVGPLGDARRQNRHQAIIVVARGARPGLCPSNAKSFLHPFGPPVLQISSEEAPFLIDCVRHGLTAVLTAHVQRTQAEAFNVTATIQGTDREVPPLVVMTPRSGWWSCASERGGGLACWLEIMRAFRDAKPTRDILFVASSGHEIGARGIEVYIDRRAGIVTKANAWIHLGANIGAAQGAGNLLQASTDEMESKLADVMTQLGLRIDQRVPRGTVPGSEAANVHRGGGRYVSIVGNNALFHNPMDQGPEAVDLNVIARFANAFAMIARSLSSG